MQWNSVAYYCCMGVQYITNALSFIKIREVILNSLLIQHEILFTYMHAIKQEGCSSLKGEDNIMFYCNVNKHT